MKIIFFVCAIHFTIILNSLQYNVREKNRNAKLIIEMVGNTTKILNPHKKSSDKEFNFDYSYWSHDGYQERDDGYLEPTEGRYADQVRHESVDRKNP